MELRNYIKKTEFAEKNELQKTMLLAYHFDVIKGKHEFTLDEICQALEDNGFSKPNLSRLKKKLSSSKEFIKSKSKDSFKLHFKSKKQLEDNLTFLSIESEEIITSNDILPQSLYKNTRGYIEKLALQLNASYENNIPDGCAVLMRRLLEVLLILGYQHIGKEQEIRDSATGELKNLSSIINYTISNKIFSLSKGSYSCIDSFRKLGNFSAHIIHYNCKKVEIEKVRMEYRVLVEELLYKSGIKS